MPPQPAPAAPLSRLPIRRHFADLSVGQVHYGHDPYAYLKDVLERLPSQPASRIAELLPHRWKITAAAS